MKDEHQGAGTTPANPPPLPESFGKPLTPLPGGERNLTMDVLRGVALLGILIANMVFFSNPLDGTGLQRNGLWQAPIDKIADWFSLLLIEGKFYPLFSFLFGLGFSVQMNRATMRGKNLSGAFRRRLGILMVFGFLHAIFLWDGDVLFLYGLCGLALLLFRNRKQKTVAIWAGALIALPGLLILLLGLLFMLLLAIPESAREFRDIMLPDSEGWAELNKAYVTGGYWDAVVYRLGNWPLLTFLMLLSSPTFFGMFLVGLLAGQKGIFQDPDSNRKSLTKVLILGGGIGMAVNFLGASMTVHGASSEHAGFLFLGLGFITLGGPVLSCGYIAGAVILIGKNPRMSIYKALASAGRMPLTNYLLQSLVATTIFYGYGIGLAGRLGRLETIGLAVFIFTAQLGFSYFWMKRFRFGPMEWIWRSATYGKLQPMRLSVDTVH